jgi:hypothetical protein
VARAGAQTKRARVSAHEGFLLHAGYRWAKIATALCVVAIAAYFLVDVKPRPSGGTWYGYLLGTTGAGLIVWLACLGIRKRAVTAGHYSLKAWVSAHVYLGLSLIVIATLHTGFQFGFNVHTLAYVLMLLVITSGAVGVWAYIFLPAAMSANRGEVTRRQMLDALQTFDDQLHEAAQTLDRDKAAIVRLSLEKTEIAGAYWQRVLSLYGGCATTQAIGRLERVRPGAVGAEAATLARIDELLRLKAEALAFTRRQVRITALLEGWTFVHVPLTFGLLAALTAHIVSVFFYW